MDGAGLQVYNGIDGDVPIIYVVVSAKPRIVVKKWDDRPAKLQMELDGGSVAFLLRPT